MIRMLKQSAFFLMVFFFVTGTVNADDFKEKCKKINDGEALSTLGLKAEDIKISELQDICELVLAWRTQEPDQINKVIQPQIERHNGLAFLRDINFKIRLFDATDSTPSGLGFTYDYAKTFEIDTIGNDGHDDVSYGWTWDFKAKGNVAFDKEINPHDFLDTRIALTAYRNQGGVALFKQSPEFFQRLNDLEDQAAEIENEDELAKHFAKKDSLINEIRSSLNSTQIYTGANLNAGLESNQSFTQRQWTYGGQIGLDIKNYNRQSAVAKYNILDYPFALIRMFTGYYANNDFITLGSTLPTLVVGYERVDPFKNDQRKALGEEDSYDRMRAEIYFRTPLAHIKSDEVYFNFDYRYLKELDAPAAIKNADLDQFDYMVISFTSEKGTYISYTEGRLPFDLKDQVTYEVGWKFNF